MLLITNLVWSQPKIGLTLSGGGAKGLAHIGILEAIDSAGLRVDCITGTSMGSIIGSLYAAGYSGKEIERIARDIDWNFLFSENLPFATSASTKKLSSIIMLLKFHSRTESLR